ncbi:ABC transporter ATP-binding protein [Microbacterium dauci]|uniref:ABC transporter ATP-binding protein n=1 Tax=Microbacterium dauci TaxID=3048008 RepID=A0ABT6ZGE1_9MICO|nr:ABC transporter ATP-binding protein [Microbacterium sp. LX3-4]MDJ1115214.1 ABC transporter ATP-binding protein [Microbacterium sp. LX3-4]
MTVQHAIRTERLVAGYGGKTIVDGIDLEIPPGRVSVIVGANACGKSTLLKTLSRLITPLEGGVVLDGKRIDQIPTKELARTLGLLPQQPVSPEGIVVADLVGRGRHPHQKLFRSWTPDDDRAVTEALAATGVLELADRAVDELSGGQRQRVWIAMALAQETEILLLDEPTTFLDVSHQIEVLDLLTDLNAARGTTIVMVLHDINLAARYADHIFALRAGSVVASGAPADIVDADLMREVFDLDCRVIPDPVSGAPLVLPRGRHRLLAD